MAVDNMNDLVLNREESIHFIHNMLHPDTELLRRRDAFLSSLDGLNVSYHDGVIVAECPDIDWPDDVDSFEMDDVLYARTSALQAWNGSTLQVKQTNGVSVFSSLFDRQRPSNYGTAHLFQDDRMINANDIPCDPKAA